MNDIEIVSRISSLSYDEITTMHDTIANFIDHCSIARLAQLYLIVNEMAGSNTVRSEVN